MKLVKTLLDFFKPRAETLEDILKEVKVAELNPGVTYIVVANRNAVPSLVLIRLQNYFIRAGLKPPVVLSVNPCGGNEVRIIRLDPGKGDNER